MSLENLIENRINDLIREDEEELEEIRKNHPNWSPLECVEVHQTENWKQFLIAELETLLRKSKR